ncbi:hypothetical protein DR64_3440 [Paraburkholderia xenovorans LB400]|nr:hypothetical protein [Paraburkholderia xenovorans]AIP33498.1 hypothetical protein DR64_3440 [Paraburkholderia xenovorans LB400]
MAIRSRPSWDMSRSEIDRRAKEVKVDNYFAKQRADSARADAASRETDRAILRATARNLTVDQVMELSAAIRRGENPDLVSILSARADSATVKDGLRMVKSLDQADRPHFTFELQPGQTKRGTWMRPFCGDMYEQLRICKTPPTPQQAATYEAAWRATQAEIASGVITSLPEIG